MTGDGSPRGTGLEDTGADAPQAAHARLLFEPRATLDALARHRRRFSATVATLGPDELASASRCGGWTVADVLRHLLWADTTMRQIWCGEAPPVENFDPRITPDQWVQDYRRHSDEDIRARYLSSSTIMAAELESADAERFGQPSLSPLGAVPWWLSAVHIGWDSTVHERDVLLPLGRPVEPPAAENVPMLAYTLVLVSFFARGGPRRVRVGPVLVRRDDGAVAVSASPTPDHSGGDPPTASVTVAPGDDTAAIDALCGRGSVVASLDGDPAVVEELGGLARFFTST